MPYKFNESRRHKIPTARYRVTNWPEYDAALVRRSVGAAGQPHGVAHRGSGGGVARAGDWRAGWPASLFGDRHRDWPGASPGVPPAAASDRGPAAVDRQCAQGRYRYPGPHDAEPPRRWPGGFAEPARARRAAASPRRQHWPQDLWRGRVARSETWPPIAPPLAQACMGLLVSSAHCRHSVQFRRSAACHWVVVKQWPVGGELANGGAGHRAASLYAVGRVRPEP